jgi:hypothetical protein
VVGDRDESFHQECILNDERAVEVGDGDASTTDAEVIREPVLRRNASD